jgi:predicted site-specific integrase-resolvase
MITRQDAADTLGISVRSIDRYIKSWKIRSEKKWKKVYVHSDDINNMQLWNNEIKHVIISEDTIKKEITDKGQFSSQKLSKKGDYEKLSITFENVYTDLRNQIDKKDEMIQKMSIEIWKSQEQVKQSISVSEHNRSQMMLEESKTHIAKQMTSLNDNKKELEIDLKKERFDKKVLILLVFIFLWLSAYFWFQIV